jgi:hypothetical protein
MPMKRKSKTFVANIRQLVAQTFMSVGFIFTSLRFRFFLMQQVSSTIKNFYAWYYCTTTTVLDYCLGFRERQPSLFGYDAHKEKITGLYLILFVNGSLLCPWLFAEDARL